MPDRYKKIQPKLKPLPFIIIGVIIVAVVAFVLILKDTPKQAFHKEYSAYGAYRLEEDHVFNTISYKTFKKKLKAEEKMIVYFGSPTCQACVEEVPLYDKEFKSEDLDLSKYFKGIYYVDTRKLSTKEKNEIIDKYFYTPEDTLLLYFENGELQLDRYMFTQSENVQGNIHLFLKEVKNKQK